MNVQTEVLRTGPTQFDMVGRSLGAPLSTTNEIISAGLTQRLVRYANNRLVESGFDFAAKWEVSVYTADADDKPSDRRYNVRYTNTKNGCIEICGILTRGGWPFLDFGFEIQA